MKRIAIAMLFWSLVSAVMAQSQFKKAADAAFVNLDKSGVTSGILYDRVFPSANLIEPTAPSSSVYLLFSIIRHVKLPDFKWG